MIDPNEFTDKEWLLVSLCANAFLLLALATSTVRSWWRAVALSEVREELKLRLVEEIASWEKSSDAFGEKVNELQAKLEAKHEGK